MKDVIMEALLKARAKGKSAEVVIRYLRMKFKVLITKRELSSRL